MRKQRLHFDNLHEVLKSSKNARSKGTQQFETPREIAEALCPPLSPVRPIVVDLQCGHGALLHAAALTGPRKDTRHLLGIDIDPTANIPEYRSRYAIDRRGIHGDFTKLAPLLLRRISSVSGGTSANFGGGMRFFFFTRFFLMNAIQSVMPSEKSQPQVTELRGDATRFVVDQIEEWRAMGYSEPEIQAALRRPAIPSPRPSLLHDTRPLTAETIRQWREEGYTAAEIEIGWSRYELLGKPRPVGASATATAGAASGQ